MLCEPSYAKQATAILLQELKQIEGEDGNLVSFGRVERTEAIQEVFPQRMFHVVVATARAIVHNLVEDAGRNAISLGGDPLECGDDQRMGAESGAKARKVGEGKRSKIFNSLGDGLRHTFRCLAVCIADPGDIDRGGIVAKIVETETGPQQVAAIVSVPVRECANVEVEGDATAFHSKAAHEKLMDAVSFPAEPVTGRFRSRPVSWQGAVGGIGEEWLDQDAGHVRVCIRLLRC